MTGSACTISLPPIALTAHAAWRVVKPCAQNHAANPVLTFITSGTDLNVEGRSRTWEFGFYVPESRSSLLVSLMPVPAAGDGDVGLAAIIALTVRITPCFQPPATGLPFDFRDSPDVVAEFSRAGVDFVAGSTDMKLEARRLASGQAVWLTYDWDRVCTTAFECDLIHD